MPETLENLMKFIQMSQAPGPVPDDHTCIGGRILLYNLVSSDEGKDMLEQVFGMPFIQQDPHLFQLLNLVCAVLGFVHEQGMPDLTEHYFNCSEDILTNLQETVDGLADKIKKSPIPADKATEIIEQAQLDLDRVRELYTPWEPVNGLGTPRGLSDESHG